MPKAKMSNKGEKRSGEGGGAVAEAEEEDSDDDSLFNKFKNLLTKEMAANRHKKRHKGVGGPIGKEDRKNTNGTRRTQESY